MLLSALNKLVVLQIRREQSEFYRYKRSAEGGLLNHFQIIQPSVIDLQ